MASSFFQPNGSTFPGHPYQMTSPWPTYEACEFMATFASSQGLSLKLEEVEGKGWKWMWRDEAKGVTFTGETSAAPKAVALVCALMAVPVVG